MTNNTYNQHQSGDQRGAMEAPEARASGAARMSYTAYVVNDYDDGKPSVWNRVGKCFQHNDGRGFNLLLDGRVEKGTLVIRADKLRADYNVRLEKPLGGGRRGGFVARRR